MKHPRYKLQVSTFPFLAVLLCAMGSLILVLLVMDRNAKRSARAKAEAEARQIGDSEHERLVAARKAELEQRRRELQADWERKKRELSTKMDGEQKALEAELRDVQARLADAARKLAAETGSLQALRSKLTQEKARLAEQEQALARAQGDLAAVSQHVSATEQARGKLAADLAVMEKAAKELTEARSRDPKTYSLLPYSGKRGASRRPIYIECASAGLVFHPEKQKVPGGDTKALRDEVARRFAAQAALLVSEKAEERKPYLMLLVRPDGINRYYEVREAMRGVDIAFGYELVDADWEFHVPDESSPSAPSAVVKMMPPASRRGSGEGPSLGDGPSLGGPPPAHPDAPLPVPGGGAPKLLPPGVAGAGGPPAGGGATKTAATRPEAPKETPPVASKPGTTGGAPARPADHNPYTAPPDSPTIARSGEPADNSPRLPQLPPATLKPDTRPRPMPMRAARVSSDDVIAFVECCADYVVVHPGRRVVTRDALERGDGVAALAGHVRDGLDRKPLSGGTPRPHLRFLVRPDAERTFHLVHPLLAGVKAEKSRYSVQPEDDISRLILGR